MSDPRTRRLTVTFRPESITYSKKVWQFVFCEPPLHITWYIDIVLKRNGVSLNFIHLRAGNVENHHIVTFCTTKKFIHKATYFCYILSTWWSFNQNKRDAVSRTCCHLQGSNPTDKRCVGDGYIKRQSLSGSVTENQRNMETLALFLAVLCYGHLATEGSPLRIEWTGLDDPWGLLRILRTGYNAGDIGER